MNLQDFISAILLNNPTAVAEKLQTRGILQEYLMPDELYTVIIDAMSGMGDREAKAFLVDVLSVPVDFYGENADFLTASSNRTTLQNLIEKQHSDKPEVQIGKWFSQMNVNWISILFVLFCLLMIALIFRLLQQRK